MSLLLVVLMLLQALPVARWVQETSVAFCSLAEDAAEDNSCKNNKETKADYKAFLPLTGFDQTLFIKASPFPSLIMQLPLLPHLELSTPPPDAC